MQALFVFVVTLVRLFLHSFFACIVAFLLHEQRPDNSFLRRKSVMVFT